MAEGVLKEMSADQVYRMIGLYQAREHLWRKSHEEYLKKNKRDAGEAEIAEALDISVKNLKKRWKYLRQIYLQNRNKMTLVKNGSGQSKDVKWKYFSALNFLSGEMTQSGAVDNLAILGPDASTALEITKNNSEPHRKRRKPQNKIKTDTGECLEVLMHAMAQNGEKDQHQVFGEFVASELREIDKISQRTMNEIKDDIQLLIIAKKREMRESLRADMSDPGEEYSPNDSYMVTEYLSKSDDDKEEE